MSHRHHCGARATLRALTGLDIGLRVRIEVQSLQRPMFSGPENQAADALIAELVDEIRGLRVYSYSLRWQLEQAASALQLNAACCSWRYARRAAQDLSGLLAMAAKRGLADRERCLCGAHSAQCVAELIGREVRQ